ncbi:MAG: hypothetical protein NT917_17115 [Microcystis aeruginosa WS75]|jgi:hypothetical protein|nr:hypothetical protein [Microcystis aeruginosa WS75]
MSNFPDIWLIARGEIWLAVYLSLKKNVILIERLDTIQGDKKCAIA